MKQLFTLILCTVFAMNLFAQTTDTTEVKVMKKNVVTVVEDDDKVHVIVGDNPDKGVEVITDDWGDTTHIRVGRRTFRVIEGSNGTYVKIDKEVKSKKWHGRFNPHWAGLEVGVNIIAESDYSLYSGTDYEKYGDFIDLNPGKSLSWNLNLMEFAFKNERKTFGVVTGLGFSFTDYTFNDPITLEKQDGYGMVIPVSILHETSSVKKTKLHVNYLTAPLMLEIKTPLRMGSSRLYLAGGVIGSLYLGSHTKYKYHNHDKQKSKSGFHINQWKYELTGRIGFGDFCVFANYSMTSLFKDGRGPEVYPLMIGISFPNI
ncbi:MAG: outer membrane beta-barrel protein [Bacteroidota bacterium]